MVITLTDSGTKEGTSDDVKLYIPVNPEKIKYRGAARFQEYTIIGLGDAKTPAGEEISSIGWECFFPGEELKSQPYVKKWKAPKTIHNQLEKWKQKGTKLKLNITESPFSLWVYIDTYEAEESGPHGTMYYTIEFSKAITISVEKVAKKATTTKKTSGTSRSSKKTTTKKHTIKSGDTLWGISKKYYKDGSKWKKIYNANKSTIENAAKKRGFKSSNNGNRIWPGTVLKIP